MSGGDDQPFGPTDPEWCPADFTKAGEPNTEHLHCECWYECDPCCRCGDDTPDPTCDCPRCTAARVAAPLPQEGAEKP